MNVKTVIRNALPFVNFGTLVRLTAGSPLRRNRLFFIFEDTRYTYGGTYKQARRFADLFLCERKKRLAQGRLGKTEKLAVGIYQENTPEFLFAAFGAALSNSVLFCINTGFRGTTLANVINQSGISMLLTTPAWADEIKAGLDDFNGLSAENILVAGGGEDARSGGFTFLEDALFRSEGRSLAQYKPPMDNTAPVLVIYTSGTTGMPKGVPCAHLKMFGAGFVVQSAVRLKKDDVGYIANPLFHSNAWFIGVLTALVSGSGFVLKRSFSASAFEEDMLKYGVTFMNYVGQPLHYIIAALEKKYGGGKAVENALARHPNNRFWAAYGNGAPAVDRQKLIGYLGMEHIYEIYGSTEAVITTVNKPGDPIDSVGEIQKDVVILNETGGICPPGLVNDSGFLVNYAQAVGEIAKKTGRNNLRFEGYFQNFRATEKKFRDGYYHSGDLGHVRIVNSRRYLYFNGRTDDWVRKDGENFSAENVAEYASRLPGVKLAIAFGAPSEVSDEKVMVALQLNDGAPFDPAAAFSWFDRQQKAGGMDPKWMPDYIRIIDDFSLTNTQKLLVRPFKRQHFNIESFPDMTIYFRRRGDDTYHLLTPAAYEQIRQEFVKTGREQLLDAGQAAPSTQSN